MTPGFFLQRLDERPSEIVQQFMPHLPYPLLQKAESLRLALLEVENEVTQEAPEGQSELFPSTAKRDMVLKFILRHLKEWGRHPTYWQICGHMKWKSLSSAQHVIQKLVESGHIERVGRKYKIVRDANGRKVVFSVEGP